MRDPRVVLVLVLLVACGGSTALETDPTPFGSGGIDGSANEAASADASSAEASTAAASSAEASSSPGGGTGSDATLANDTGTDGALQQSDAPSPCDDGIKDGNETDIDCGGSCLPCGIGQACRLDGDCGTSSGCSPASGCACDAVSMTCVYDHCFDHKKDGDETDIDCGDTVTPCTGCAVGLMCQGDGNCASVACDALTSLCAATQCSDHRQDGLETAVDCGGGLCPACALNQGCSVDADCTSNACDLASFACVADQCDDHRTDGVETDADCGGSVCTTRCQPGQHCLGNPDCIGGHFCNAVHVCQ